MRCRRRPVAHPTDLTARGNGQNGPHGNAGMMEWQIGTSYWGLRSTKHRGGRGIQQWAAILWSKMRQRKTQDARVCRIPNLAPGVFRGTRGGPRHLPTPASHARPTGKTSFSARGLGDPIRRGPRGGATRGGRGVAWTPWGGLWDSLTAAWRAQCGQMNERHACLLLSLPNPRALPSAILFEAASVGRDWAMPGRAGSLWG